MYEIRKKLKLQTEKYNHKKKNLGAVNVKKK